MAKAPGVEVRERNLAQTISSVSSAAAALVGVSSRGRTGQRITVTNSQDLFDKFGNPDTSVTNLHLSALGYLDGGNQLFVTRVHKDAMYSGIVINSSSASSSTSALIAGADEVDNFSFASYTDGLFAIFADNQGVWGDSVSVKVTNISQSNYTFDIQVWFTENGVTSLVETWTVSRQSKLDGFNRQLFLEDKINDNSNYIRVKNNDAEASTVLPKHEITNEILSTGDGTLTTFAGTVANTPIQAGSVTITDTAESFSDDTNGNLVGSLGGTGTINYENGVYTVTFSSAPANAQQINANYFTVTSGSLASGSDGSAVTDADIIQGWDLYDDTDVVDVRLLINGGYTSVSVQTHMQSIAEGRRDCIAILDVPTTEQSASRAIVWRRDTQNINSSYTALYTPDVKEFDVANDRVVDVPPSGHVAGIYAQTILGKPVGAAPAGTDANLSVRGLTESYTTGEQGLLYDQGINYIRTKPGFGYQVFAQKTQDQVPSPLDRVNVRLLLIEIEKALRTSLDFVIFKINNEFTRRSVVQKIEAFLQPIRDLSGDSGGLEDYRVKCDEDNNPPSVRQNHQLIADVYIKPPLTAEFIQVNVIITDAGVEFSEIISTGN